MTRTAAQAVSASYEHPFVAAVRDYAERVQRPAALATDRRGVPVRRVAELRDLGLLSHLDPDGYAGLERGAVRRAHEILARACFNTWLVWTQHNPLAGDLAESVKAGRPQGTPVSARRGRCRRSAPCPGHAVGGDDRGHHRPAPGVGA